MRTEHAGVAAMSAFHPKRTLRHVLAANTRLPRRPADVINDAFRDHIEELEAVAAKIKK